MTSGSRFARRARLIGTFEIRERTGQRLVQQTYRLVTIGQRLLQCPQPLPVASKFGAVLRRLVAFHSEIVARANPASYRQYPDSDKPPA